MSDLVERWRALPLEEQIEQIASEGWRELLIVYLPERERGSRPPWDVSLLPHIPERGDAYGAGEALVMAEGNTLQEAVWELFLDLHRTDLIELREDASRCIACGRDHAAHGYRPYHDGDPPNPCPGCDYDAEDEEGLIDAFRWPDDEGAEDTWETWGSD